MISVSRTQSCIQDGFRWGKCSCGSYPCCCSRASVSCFAPREVLHMMFAVSQTSIIFSVGNKLATLCFQTFWAYHTATADCSSILNETGRLWKSTSTSHTCFFCPFLNQSSKHTFIPLPLGMRLCVSTRGVCVGGIFV